MTLTPHQAKYYAYDLTRRATADIDRHAIFEIEDEIMTKRDHLIDALEKRLSQSTEAETLFNIRWKVV